MLAFFVFFLAFLTGSVGFARLNTKRLTSPPATSDVIHTTHLSAPGITLAYSLKEAVGGGDESPDVNSDVLDFSPSVVSSNEITDNHIHLSDILLSSSDEGLSYRYRIGLCFVHCDVIRAEPPLLTNSLFLSCSSVDPLSGINYSMNSSTLNGAYVDFNSYGLTVYGISDSLQFMSESVLFMPSTCEPYVSVGIGPRIFGLTSSSSVVSTNRVGDSFVSFYSDSFNTVTSYSVVELSAIAINNLQQFDLIVYTSPVTFPFDWVSLYASSRVFPILSSASLVSPWSIKYSRFLLISSTSSYFILSLSETKLLGVQRCIKLGDCVKCPFLGTFSITPVSVPDFLSSFLVLSGDECGNFEGSFTNRILSEALSSPQPRPLSIGAECTEDSILLSGLQCRDGYVVLGLLQPSVRIELGETYKAVSITLGILIFMSLVLSFLYSARYSWLMHKIRHSGEMNIRRSMSRRSFDSPMHTKEKHLGSISNPLNSSKHDLYVLNGNLAPTSLQHPFPPTNMGSTPNNPPGLSTGTPANSNSKVLVTSNPYANYPDSMVLAYDAADALNLKHITGFDTVEQSAEQMKSMLVDSMAIIQKKRRRRKAILSSTMHSTRGKTPSTPGDSAIGGMGPLTDVDPFAPPTTFFAFLRSEYEVIPGVIVVRIVSAHTVALWVCLHAVTLMQLFVVESESSFNFGIGISACILIMPFLAVMGVVGTLWRVDDDVDVEWAELLKQEELELAHFAATRPNNSSTRMLHPNASPTARTIFLSILMMYTGLLPPKMSLCGAVAMQAVLTFVPLAALTGASALLADPFEIWPLPGACACLLDALLAIWGVYHALNKALALQASNQPPLCVRIQELKASGIDIDLIVPPTAAPSPAGGADLLYTMQAIASVDTGRISKNSAPSVSEADSNVLVDFSPAIEGLGYILGLQPMFMGPQGPSFGCFTPSQPDSATEQTVAYTHNISLFNSFFASPSSATHGNDANGSTAGSTRSSKRRSRRLTSDDSSFCGSNSLETRDNSFVEVANGKSEEAAGLPNPLLVPIPSESLKEQQDHAGQNELKDTTAENSLKFPVSNTMGMPVIGVMNPMQAMGLNMNLIPVNMSVPMNMNGMKVPPNMSGMTMNMNSIGMVPYSIYYPQSTPNSSLCELNTIATPPPTTNQKSPVRTVTFESVLPSTKSPHTHLNTSSTIPTPSSSSSVSTSSPSLSSFVGTSPSIVPTVTATNPLLSQSSSQNLFQSQSSSISRKPQPNPPSLSRHAAAGSATNSNSASSLMSVSTNSSVTNGASQVSYSLVPTAASIRAAGSPPAPGSPNQVEFVNSSISSSSGSTSVSTLTNTVPSTASSHHQSPVTSASISVSNSSHVSRASSASRYTSASNSSSHVRSPSVHSTSVVALNPFFNRPIASDVASPSSSSSSLNASISNNGINSPSSVSWGVSSQLSAPGSSPLLTRSAVASAAPSAVRSSTLYSTLGATTDTNSSTVNNSTSLVFSQISRLPIGVSAVNTLRATSASRQTTAPSQFFAGGWGDTSETDGSVRLSNASESGPVDSDPQAKWEYDPSNPINVDSTTDCDC